MRCLILILVSSFCEFLTEAKSKCVYSSWQKKMVCDDESGGGGGGGSDGGESDVPKTAGAGAKRKPTHAKKVEHNVGGYKFRPHSKSKTVRQDSGYWPSPLKLVQEGTYAMNTSKIAFMFLTRGEMPMENLWKRFFRPEHKSKATLYLHPTPDFDCDKEVPPPLSPCAGVVCRFSYPR